MGNEVPRPKKRSRKGLYSVTFTPGDIHFSDEEKYISVELLFHCDRGEVGPIPLAQVTANEDRKMQVWHADLGNPKYLILVMHKELHDFPRWAMKKCVVEASRKNELVATTFCHEGTMGGGDAAVYSVTLAPCRTTIENYTFPQDESGDEDEEEIEMIPEDTLKQE